MRTPIFVSCVSAVSGRKPMKNELASAKRTYNTMYTLIFHFRVSIVRTLGGYK